MFSQVKLGNAFGTSLSLHVSWLWIVPFAIASLVWFDIEPLFEAAMASLLMMGSVLAATLARVWTASRLGLEWERVTFFLLGGVVQRKKRSNPWQEAQIAAAGHAVKLALAILFGTLWYLLPSGALGIEMEIVALFNIGLLVFSLLLRLSPNHDNLLHAALASTLDAPTPHYVMTFIHSVALVAFAVSSVFMLGLNWIGFGWWFIVAVMLSQLTTVAESYGEYRSDIDSAETASPSNSTSVSFKKSS